MPDGLGTLNDETAFMYDHDDSTGQAEPVETEGGFSAFTMPGCASMQVKGQSALMVQVHCFLPTSYSV